MIARRYRLPVDLADWLILAATSVAAVAAVSALALALRAHRTATKALRAAEQAQRSWNADWNDKEGPVFGISWSQDDDTDEVMVDIRHRAGPRPGLVLLSASGPAVRGVSFPEGETGLPSLKWTPEDGEIVRVRIDVEDPRGVVKALLRLRCEEHEGDRKWLREYRIADPG